MSDKFRIKDYMIHWDWDGFKLNFSAWLIADATGPKGKSIVYLKNGGASDELNDECICLFRGLALWRGVWEISFWFADDEYEIDGIRDALYVAEEVSKWAKDFIKTNKPHEYYED